MNLKDISNTDILKPCVIRKGLVYYVYSNLANNKIAEAHSK